MFHAYNDSKCLAEGCEERNRHKSHFVFFSLCWLLQAPSSTFAILCVIMCYTYSYSLLSKHVPPIGCFWSLLSAGTEGYTYIHFSVTARTSEALYTHDMRNESHMAKNEEEESTTVLASFCISLDSSWIENRREQQRFICISCVEYKFFFFDF